MIISKDEAIRRRKVVNTAKDPKPLQMVKPGQKPLRKGYCNLEILRKITLPDGSRLADQERFVPFNHDSVTGKHKGVSDFPSPEKWKTLDGCGAGGRTLPTLMLANTKIMVIDYDGLFYPDEGIRPQVDRSLLDAWERMIETAMHGSKTYTEKSKTLSGKHMVFALPETFPIASKDGSYHEKYCLTSVENRPKNDDTDHAPAVEIFVGYHWITLTGNCDNDCYQIIGGDTAIDVFYGAIDLIIEQKNADAERSAKAGKSVPYAYGDADEELIVDALKAIPADDYHLWTRMGMTIKQIGLSEGIFDEWSAGSPHYGQVSEKWHSFPDTGKLTAGTIFYHAMEYGWKFPKRKTRKQKPKPEKNILSRSREEAEKASNDAFDEIDKMLDHDSKGKIANTPRNYEVIMQNDPSIKGRIRYNAMDCIPYIVGAFWNTADHRREDIDITFLRSHISAVYGLKNREEVEAAVDLTAMHNVYHPIVDILNSLKWDGVPRLDRLFVKYLGAPDTPLTHAITRMTFFGAIQRVFRPGCKFDSVLILNGGQGTGKSTLCRMMALDDKYFTDSLKNLDDEKAAAEKLRGKWVVELGEMIATRRAKDVETIKGFLSATSDYYREAYAHFARDTQRQCIFIGTSNRSDSLPSDSTGNRRFFPLVCDASKIQRHPLDNEQETRQEVLQCYAEAMVRGRQEGFPLTLDRKYLDELNGIREDAVPQDMRIDMIQAFLDKYQDDYVCSQLIWQKVFKDLDHPEQVARKDELSGITEILNHKVHGWRLYQGNAQHRRRFEGFANPQKAWERVPEDLLQASVTT